MNKVMQTTQFKNTSYPIKAHNFISKHWICFDERLEQWAYQQYAQQHVIFEQEQWEHYINAMLLDIEQKQEEIEMQEGYLPNDIQNAQINKKIVIGEEER